MFKTLFTLIIIIVSTLLSKAQNEHVYYDNSIIIFKYHNMVVGYGIIVRCPYAERIVLANKRKVPLFSAFAHPKNPYDLLINREVWNAIDKPVIFVECPIHEEHLSENIIVKDTR